MREPRRPLNDSCRSAHFYLLIVLTPAISAFAGEPFAASTHHIEPAYLVPVSPQGREDEQAIEKLLGNRWGEGSMIYVDWVGGDFAMSVWAKTSRGDGPDLTTDHFVTYIKVGSGKTGRVADQEIDVPIDSEFATTVQRAWAAMLLQTRYPRNEYRGGDGFDVEFSVWVTGIGGLYGQMWSPSQGLPKEFLDLGSALAEFCKGPERDRSRERNNLMSRLEDFTGRASR